MAKAELRILQKLNQYEFGVELRCMRTGTNKNFWSFQNLDQHYMSILGQPILCAISYGRIGSGHEMEEKRLPSGETYMSFVNPSSEKIVGTISEDPADIRLVEEDGETWLIAKGKLFTFYNRELVDYIIQNGVMEVSVETEIFKSYQDPQDERIEVMTDYNILGVTILGRGVAPAIPGANIQAIKALASEFEELKLKCASYKAAEEDNIEDEDHDDEDDDVNDGPDNDESDDDEEDEEVIEPEDEEDNEPDDGDETKKPQNYNSKGVKKMQVFTKRQAAELAPKFEGYTVLSAGQNDDGIHVCLMSADGATATYTMESMDSLIDPKKIVKASSFVQFTFGEESINVESDVLTDTMGANVVRVNAELEAASAELKTAKETIESMQTAEQKRRLSACKAAAVATLEKFNANREEKVDVAVLEDINAAIDCGEYSECVDGEGEWCGEKSVCDAVLAKCAAAVMEFDKAAKARVQAAQYQYIWDVAHEDATNVDGVKGLLAKWKAEKI